ncbi:MAG: VTT domain-containing protein [Desulforegulaceae bacterium]|nr:VTT domain-containing protein [Desulforegulaceae bacterium]
MTSLILKGADPFFCVLSASIGNILGSILNYFAGFFGSRLIFEKYLKSKQDDLEKGISRFNKFGKISLFFAWLPIIGDPLTLAAGVLKINFYYFFMAVSIGKVIRYLIIIKAALT